MTQEPWENRLVKIHYEPEHSDGGVCWCDPKKTVEDGVLTIVHNEQRDVLKAFMSQVIQEERAKLKAIEYLYEHSEYANEWSGAGMWHAVMKVLESKDEITIEWLKTLLQEAKDF